MIMKDICEATRTVYKFSKIFGLTAFSIRQSGTKKHLVLLKKDFPIVIWQIFIIGWLVHDVDNSSTFFGKNFTNYLQKALNDFQNKITIINQIVLFLFMYLNRNNVNQIFNCSKDIDELMKHMNIDMDYSSVAKHSKRVLKILCVLNLISPVTATFMIIAFYQIIKLGGIREIFTQCMRIGMITFIGAVLFDIKLKLIKINNNMDTIFQQNSFRNENNGLINLENISKVFNKISTYSELVNTTFNAVFLTVIGISFVNFVATVYFWYAFKSETESSDEWIPGFVIDIVTANFQHTHMVFYLLYSVNNIVNQERLFFFNFNNIRYKNYEADTCEMVGVHLLKLKQYRIKFSLYNILDIDNTLFYTMIASSATYFIILCQII